MGQLSEVDALVQLSFVVQLHLERYAAESGLSSAQTRLLGVLRDRTPTMAQLADLLESDKSSVSGLVDRAEGRGLVRRIPSTLDRRSLQVCITPAGRRLIAGLSERFAAQVQSLLNPLPKKDRAALTRSIERVVVAHAAEAGVDLFDTL